MKMELTEDKFHIRAYFSSCSCKCKFCCLGDYPKRFRISFDDYEMIMRKFADINDYNGMRLRSFIYNCIEHPYVKRQIELYKELGLPEDEFTHLDINGTKIKSKEEISSWFDMLQDAGMKQASFSWFGLEKTHDQFVSREGYFKYLMDCADEAAKRGIPVGSKVFLHRGIFDDLEQLINLLKLRGDSVKCAFMEYTGHGKEIPHDFLTADDAIYIAPILSNYMSEQYSNKFKPESEWIDLAVNGGFPKFTIVDYVLYVNSENLEQIKQTSVSDIIGYFRQMDSDFRNSFESVRFLAELYGDKSCDILYECRDIMRKWLDKHYQKNNLNREKLFSFTNNSVVWKVYERL